MKATLEETQVHEVGIEDEEGQELTRGGSPGRKSRTRSAARSVSF